MKKTDYRLLKKGDKISMISFMTVVTTGTSVGVIDEDGKELYIGNGVFDSSIFSTQVKEEKKVSKTELANILINARDAVVQVNFHKQASADTVHAKLTDADGKKITKKLLADLLKGEERVMTGYVIATEPVLGRTVMIDLEKEKNVVKGHDSRQRQVDHRTLNSVVYKGVKYFVK